MQKVIEIVDGVTRHPLYRMKEPVNLCIRKGEQTAIVGEKGREKTTRTEGRAKAKRKGRAKAR